MFGLIATIKRFFKRLRRQHLLSKRQQFVIIIAILTAGLVLTQLSSVEWRYPLVAVLALLAFILSAWGLREDLSGVEWLTLLILPTSFTAAVGLFYFLLPVRWLTRLPVAVLYAVGMYALLLTENIYNVAASRTIALLRAAHSVGFLLTLVTYFLLVQTILAFRFVAPINAIFVGLTSSLLILQALWAVELTDHITRNVWQLTVILTVALIELVWILSFWPVRTTLQALFLTTCFYSFVGMAQQYLSLRLYKKTVIEFFMVTLIVLLIVFMATRFRGGA